LQTVSAELLAAITSGPLAKSLTDLDLRSNFGNSTRGDTSLKRLRQNIKVNRQKCMKTHGHKKKMDFGHDRFSEHDDDEIDWT